MNALGTTRPLPGDDPAEPRAHQPERIIRGWPWLGAWEGTVPMIQKKVCMVGLFGTGKTSLVQQFVHSMFSERYLSTVGVKIDRKELELDGTALTLVLWDLAGRDKHEDITSSYLRGAHADPLRSGRHAEGDLRPASRTACAGPRGRRRRPRCTGPQQERPHRLVGARPGDEEALAGEWDLVRTSAKTGDGVEEVFRRIGRATLASREARP